MVKQMPRYPDKQIPKNSNMSLSKTLSKHDLRSSAKERKRDIDTKRKWAPKWAVTGVPVTKEDSNGIVRPVAHIASQRAAAKDTQYNERAIRWQNLQRKRLPVLNDDSNDLDDLPSTDPDYGYSAKDEPSQAYDVDVKYSYDASRGPAHESEILGLAVTRAVEKYEDDKTTKLVNDEYDVLDMVSEADVAGPSYTKTDESDDDFELI